MVLAQFEKRRFFFLTFFLCQRTSGMKYTTLRQSRKRGDLLAEVAVPPDEAIRAPVLAELKHLRGPRPTSETGWDHSIAN